MKRLRCARLMSVALRAGRFTPAVFSAKRFAWVGSGTISASSGFATARRFAEAGEAVNYSRLRRVRTSKPGACIFAGVGILLGRKDGWAFPVFSLPFFQLSPRRIEASWKWRVPLLVRDIVHFRATELLQIGP
jgi:hypothetical protein